MAADLSFPDDFPHWPALCQLNQTQLPYSFGQVLAMGLAKYKAKRNFGITPEPAGKEDQAHSRQGALSFVIQKHAASHLHYDFRLEMEGVLRSWAVPKGPSLDPADKRLAMEVEDHPLDYGDFEGIIPAGQYGGGTVMLWDQGTWEPEGDGDPVEMWKKGSLKFQLHGTKLKGSWALVRIGGRHSSGDEGKEKRSWLLIKHRDEAARPADEYSVTDKLNKSVATKRTMEQIASEKTRVWQSNREEKEPSAQKGSAAEKLQRIKSIGKAIAGDAAQEKVPAKKSPKGRAVSPKPPPTSSATNGKTGTKTPMPDTIRPQLATLVKSAPSGSQWVHEIKLDGYRMVAFLDHRKVRLITRNGNDWTDRFTVIAEAVRALPVDQAILDGEIVAINEHGVTSFQQLQNAIDSSRVRQGGSRLAYVIFDLLFLNGLDARPAPLLQRKELLQQLLAMKQVETDLLRFSQHLTEEGAAVLQQACSHALEGIISKRADAKYEEGRTATWLKTKCVQRQELIIGGWTNPEGGRTGFGSLIVGVRNEKGQLQFAGKVGTGFTQKSLESMKKRLDKLATDKSPFANTPRNAEMRRAHWVRPELVCEVEFTEWTDDGKLRHPSFQGLREDKPASEVVMEKPKTVSETAIKSATQKGRAVSPKPSPKSTNAASNPKSSSKSEPPSPPAHKTHKKGERVTVAGVDLSSPDKVMYPEQGITKLELARYYEAVGPHMFPYIDHRPLTLIRCPAGRGKNCFIQRHAHEDNRDLAGVVELSIREGGKTAKWLGVDSITGLVALVQMGTLEFHTWGSTADAAQTPDRITLDLDPGPEVSWDEVVRAAFDVKKMMEREGLKPFVKTTGGNGLHVVAPIELGLTADQVRNFAEAMARELSRNEPDRFVSVMTKSKRVGKIYVDYLRNAYSASAIATFSTRAREGAPVSMPLSWKQLQEGITPTDFNVRTVSQILKSRWKDPWKDFDKNRRKLKSAK